MLVVQSRAPKRSVCTMQSTLALSIGGICTVGRATGTGMKAAVSISSSRQQCRRCATDVCACEVTKRTIVQMVNVMKLRLALDDRTKYRNRVSAASDS